MAVSSIMNISGDVLRGGKITDVTRTEKKEIPFQRI